MIAWDVVVVVRADVVRGDSQLLIATSWHSRSHSSMRAGVGSGNVHTGVITAAWEGNRP